MKIFWSWQSDIEGNVSRHFIKNCLKNAVDLLNEETIFESRVEVDHDTKDVLGSPSITETIFNKIKNCTVFIGDLTPITSTKKRKVMNPNVAIEIGYALALLGDDKVITIMNNSFGSISDLPFNLRHKRGPLTYSLNNRASKNEIEKEEKKLTNILKVILKDYITNSKLELKTSLNLDLNGHAIFFDLKKPLLMLSSDVRGSLKDKGYLFTKSNSYIYTKIIPQKELKFLKNDLSKAMFDGNNFKVSPLFKSPDRTADVNKYGSIIVKFDKKGDNLISDFIQIFENGTIVSISNSFLFYSGNKVYLINLKDGLEKNIKNGVNLLKNLIASEKDIEINIEIGLINGDNCSVILPNPTGNRYYTEPEKGPLEKEEYILNKRMKLKNTDDIDKIIKEYISLLVNDLGLDFNYEDHKWG
jgi:hypothetical protein